MTLDDLKKKVALSVRSYNVCYGSSLNSIEEIKEFYLKFGSFLSIRNCGEKSNKELISLSEKYINNELSFEEEKEEEKESDKQNYDLLTTVNSFNRIQRKIINNQLLLKFNSLKKRAKTSILDVLDGNLNIKELTERMLIPRDFKVEELHYVGKKTVDEIENFLIEAQELINSISKIEKQEILLKEFHSVALQKGFNLELNKVTENFLNYNFRLGIPVFLTLEVLLQNNILEDNKGTILQEGLNIYLGKEQKTLVELGKDLNITRERVRQLRNSIIDEILSKIGPLKAFNENIINTYTFNPESLCFLTSDSLAQEIASVEGVSFSNSFYTLIFHQLFPTYHELVGSMDDVFIGKNTRNRYNWKNLYLISKPLANGFDFTSLVNDIYSRINRKTDYKYSLHFPTYILGFSGNEGYDKIDDLTKICEIIINNEFDIFIDVEDNIQFNKNTFKPVTDYVYEILQKANKPLVINEIFRILKSENPGVTKNKSSLRNLCQKDGRLIYFGRSSTYGLKAWENEDENIKGGTIRSIVQELLSQEEKPIHLTEITAYVKRFRPDSNYYSIMGTLKLDTSKPFLFFNQGYVGLKSKSKTPEYICYKRIPKFFGKSLYSLIYKNINEISHLQSYLSHRFDLSKDIVNTLIDYQIFLGNITKTGNLLFIISKEKNSRVKL